MRIRNNMGALSAWHKSKINEGERSKTMKKVASGRRINGAYDDAAGFAISEKMKAQIIGLRTASRNIQDGISLVQVAEGALSEVHSILQEGRELSVQASNDTLTQSDKEKIMDKVDHIIDEINHVSKETNFNERRVFHDLNGGSSASGQLPTLPTDNNNDSGVTDLGGTNVTGIVNIDVDSNMIKDHVFKKNLNGNVSNSISKDTTFEKNINGDTNNQIQSNVRIHESINGSIGNHAMKEVTIDGSINGDIGNSIKKDVVINGNLNGNVASIDSSAVINGRINNRDYYDNNPHLTDADSTDGIDGYFNGDVNNDILGNVDGYITGSVIGDITNGVSGRIDGNVGSGAQSVTITGGVSGRIVGDIYGDIHGDITGVIEGTVYGNIYGNITGRVSGGVDGDITGNITGYIEGDTTGTITGDVHGRIGGDVGKVVGDVDGLIEGEISGGLEGEYADGSVSGVIGSDGTEDEDYIKIQHGSNSGDLVSIQLFLMDSKNLNIHNVDLVSDADKAIGKFDRAISKVSSMRAYYGAKQNRLQHSVNINDTTAENMSSAQSKIQDADIAETMMTLVRYRLLSDTSQAFLVQANQTSQGTLQLLK